MQTRDVLSHGDGLTLEICRTLGRAMTGELGETIACDVDPVEERIVGAMRNTLGLPDDAAVARLALYRLAFSLGMDIPPEAFSLERKTRPIVMIDGEGVYDARRDDEPVESEVDVEPLELDPQWRLF